ncbi:SGS-domain-containing protein [Hypoxylon trugodes]|uniref:SGS-domain-containing protein n=1 Tax=Hypoxylon trugodes TaxID=326681 RepID=UPI0021979DE4|nr:SGS-domain-containing protein [Hypoxylon trugodes]KAI1391643.1 SGS-domain-containing protein [Hypoxylon trugodes]
MPSPEILASDGVKAVTAGDYQDGISKLTQALKERPAPLWLLERSKAYVRTNKLDLALHDAEQALQVAFQRANRDQMAEAQVRRAITLFRIGRYADADIVAFWALRLLDKAKATEDDGQQNKVNENREYTVRLADVKESNKPSKSDGIAAAMGGLSGRSKDNSLRNQAFSWRIQALTRLEDLPVGDLARKVTIGLEKYPKPSELSSAGKAEVDSDNDGLSVSASKVSEEYSVTDSWKPIWELFVDRYAANSIRSSLYQTDTTLHVDFFIKDKPKHFTVEATDHEVTMGPIPAPRPESIRLHLWGKIKPEETKHTVKSMKIELVLKKATPGKWPKLEQDFIFGFNNIAGVTVVNPSFEQFTKFVSRLGYTDPEQLELPDFGEDRDAWYSAILGAFQARLDKSKVSAATDAPKIPITATGDTSVSQGANGHTQSKGSLTQANNPTVQPTPIASKTGSAAAGSSAPAYPTSSKKGAVNWDSLDVDADDDKEEGDVNSFFQKLYKDADPDTRRAMMKSYVESNGTSLSTSWAEASEKTYTTQPPDGAEAKKWD